MFWMKVKMQIKAFLCVAGGCLGFFLLQTGLNISYGQNVTANQNVSDALICSQMIKLAERAKRIPRGLLEAIARVESGRLVPDQRLTRPWPWTVTAQGSGKFYPNREAALAAIEQFQRDGVNNIDIGCMQVNFLYHGNSFDSYDEILDPVNNVAYATELLFSLFQRHRNWDQAVRFYHSSDPEKHNNYLARVVDAWQRYEEPVPLPLKLSPEVQKIEQERAILEQTQEIEPQRRRNLNPLAEENELTLKSKLFSDSLRRTLKVETLSEAKRRSPPNRTTLRNAEESNRPISGKNATFFLDTLDEAF